VTLYSDGAAIEAFRDEIAGYVEGLLSTGALDPLLDALDRAIVRAGLLERMSPCPERREGAADVAWGYLDADGRFMPRIRIDREGCWTEWEGPGGPARGRRLGRLLSGYLTFGRHDVMAFYAAALDALGRPGPLDAPGPHRLFDWSHMAPPEAAGAAGRKAGRRKAGRRKARAAP
jgi:hypothetical protein